MLFGGEILINNPVTITNHHYSFSRPFMPGGFPSSVEPLLDGVSFAKWQVTVKTRHADGSVKLALFAVVVPTVDTVVRRITFERTTAYSSAGAVLSNADILASDMQVQTNLMMYVPSGAYPAFGSTANTTLIFSALGTPSGTVPTARGLLLGGDIKYVWETGPVKRTLVLRSDSQKFGIPAAPNSATIQYVIEFWYDGSWSTTVRFLNSFPSTSTCLWFDITSITTGLATPISRVSKIGNSSIPGHFLATGMGHTFIKGRMGPNVPATINAKHGWQYYVDLGMLDNMRTGFTSTTVRDSIVNAWGAMPPRATALGGAAYDLGSIGFDEGTAGGRDDIGKANHETQLIALFFGDAQATEVSRGQALSKSSWPVFFLEDQPLRSSSPRLYDSVAGTPGLGNFISRDSRPTMFLFEHNGYWNWTTTTSNIPADALNSNAYQYPVLWNSYGLWMGGGGDYCRPDYQHQANAQWIPYLMHGDFDFYFNQMGRAHWNLFASHNDTETLSDFMNNRASAWVILTESLAAEMAIDASPEQTYLRRVVDLEWVGHLKRKAQPLPSSGVTPSLLAYYNAMPTDTYSTPAGGPNPLLFEYEGGGNSGATGQWWSWNYLIQVAGWMAKLTGNIYAEQKRKVMAQHIVSFWNANPGQANWHRNLGTYQAPALDLQNPPKWWTTWTAAYAQHNGAYGPPDTEWVNSATDLSDGFTVIAKATGPYITDTVAGSALASTVEGDISPAWGNNPKWSAVSYAPLVITSVGTSGSSPAASAFSALSPMTTTGSTVALYSISPPVPGVTIDPSTGALSSTGLAAGVYTFNRIVTSGLRASASQPYTLTITPVTTALAITSANNASGQHGVAGAFQATAAGSVPPYTWSLSGASAGISINATSGLISWAGSVA